MVRITLASRNAVILVVSLICILAAIASWWIPRSALASPPPLALILATILSALTVLSRCIQPPTVLLLGASDSPATDLLRPVNQGISPLRAVGLLETSRIYGWLGWGRLDNLRNRNRYAWKSIIYRLIDFAPIVVIDTRGSSDPLAAEAFIMLSPERAHKAVFVHDPNSHDNLLTFFGIVPTSHALHVVTAEELVPQLRKWTDSRHSLPWTQRRAFAMPQLRRPETWDNLPRVLAVPIEYVFDTDRLVTVLASSPDRELLELLFPWTDLDEAVARRLIEMSWTFVHESRLGFIYWESKGVALVRARFLLDVSHTVSPRSVSAPRPPLTFEQMTMPDPIASAAGDWFRDLHGAARSHGYSSRFL
jgi:hypothetical protein